jgi:hypothetical protein
MVVFCKHILVVLHADAYPKERRGISTAGVKDGVERIWKEAVVVSRDQG